MKKLVFVLLIFVFTSLLYGCATSKAIKQEYKKNRQGDWNASQEAKEVGKGVKKDLASIFIAIKNIFSGRVFKEYPY